MRDDMDLRRFFGGRTVWAVAVIIIGVVGYLFYAHSSKPTYTAVPVIRGAIVQEASASGKVEPRVQVDLHFKNSGRLIARTVDVSDRVDAGDILARQDTRELEAQLQEVEAGVDVQKARLAQLLAGTSDEDIRLAETAVANAQQTVLDARESVTEAIQDAYTKADDAVRTKADVIFTDPHAADPQVSFVVNNQSVEHNVELQRKTVETALKSWNALRSQLSTSADLEADVTDSQQYLQQVTSLLDYVAQALNAHVSGVTSTTLDAWKASISTARTNINTTASALVIAAEALKSAKGALVSAQDALSIKKAPARSADVALKEAEIRAAEAKIGLIEAQIGETRLVAPSEGTVTKVDGEVGEIVGPEREVVSLTPKGALQIKLNVSENNIAGVQPGQQVRITLDAFTDGIEWQGTVVAVDPAETVVGGAVYYQTTVLFNEEDDRIKSGMTANAWVITAMKDRALFIPASAIEDRDGVKYVRVMNQEGGVVERRIETGITGKQGVIEVVSGLSEGEPVMTDGWL